MLDPRSVRRELLARFLRIACVSSTGAVAVAAGCGTRTELTETEAASGSGGAGGAATAASGSATSPTSTTSTGQSGSFVSSTSATSSSSGGLDAGLVDCDGGGGGGADAGPIVLKCYQPGVGAPCATAEQILGFGGCSYFLTEIKAVYCGPFLEGTQCCYYVEAAPFGCYVGRAFLVDEGLVKSELRRGSAWRHGEAPSVTGLSEATRRALAAGWVLDGLFEHASVASFSRLSMQMLAVGAPSSLVQRAHGAALDEIRHAELCFTLASAYAGEPLDPDRFPLTSPLPVDTDLRAVAVESVIEGCIGETLAAAQAAEALACATVPAVVEALRATLEDEIRHAELAWSFVAWAIDAGGEPVRAAVAHAFANFKPPEPPREDMEGVCLETFAAHGRLTASEARRTALAAIREIVQPCCCEMLSRRGPAEKQSRRVDDVTASS